MAQRSSAHVALGRAVRAVRVERAMSQEELAHCRGLHRTYVGGVERNQTFLGFAALGVVTMTSSSTRSRRLRFGL